MLEHRLNTLDMEFIKLHAEYLIDRNPKAINERLQNLALKGQINAVALWYRLNKVGVCPEIDKFAEELNPQTYDEYSAKGFYLKHSEFNTWNSLAKNYNSLYERIREAHAGDYRWHIADTHKEEVERDASIHDILKLEFVSCFEKAAELSLHIAKEQQNPYLFQRAGALYHQFLQYTPFYKDQEFGLKLNKAALKSLYKNYKKQKKEETAITDTQFCYHFARAVLISEGNTKLRPIAVDMLKEICNYNSLQY